MKKIILKKVEVFDKKSSTMKKEQKKFLSESIANVEQLSALLDTTEQQDILKTCQSRTVTNEQKNQVKKQAVQIVAQTLGNADGSLAGSHTLTGIVAVDVDKIPEAEAEAFDAHVLAHKDELGLLWHRASLCVKNEDGVWCVGRHTYCKRQPNLTQLENLERIQAILGRPIDMAAKDITRCMFEGPSSCTIYLDNALFEEKEVAPAKGETFGKKKPGRKPKADKAQAQPEQKLTEVTTMTRGSDFVFKEVVKRASLNLDKLDVEGFRHSNCVSLLSSGCASLLTREECEKCIEKYMPSYYADDYDDCRTTIDYFFDTYEMDKRMMKREDVMLNALRQQEPQKHTSVETELPPEMPKQPRAIELLTKRFEPQYRAPLSIAALAYMAPLASHYRATTPEGREVGSQLAVAITGPSASGKRQVQDIKDMVIAHTLKPVHEAEWAKYEETKEEHIYNPDVRLHKPKLRYCEQMSTSSLLDTQKNLGPNGQLLLSFEEAIQLVKMNKRDWSDIQGFILKSWDGGYQNQKFLGAQSVSFNGNLCATIVLTGTLDAVLQGLYHNIGDGLMTRFITILLEPKFSVFGAQIGKLSDAEQKELDRMLIGLFERNELLGDETQLLDLPGTRKMIIEWLTEQDVKFEDGTYGEVEKQCFGRIATQMIKASITLTALEGHETPEIINFAKWVGETAFYYSRLLFSRRIKEQQQKTAAMLGFGYRPTPSKGDFDAMPTIFTRKQFYAMRRESGKTDGSSKTLLLRKLKEGKIEKLNSDLFKKVG